MQAIRISGNNLFYTREGANQPIGKNYQRSGTTGIESELSKQEGHNTEIEQQWQQSQHEISKEEFVQTFDIFSNLQNPKIEQHLGNTMKTIYDYYENLTEVDEDTEDEDEKESDFDDFKQIGNDQPADSRKRKNVSLCRHKLQGQTGYRSRSWKHPAHKIEDIEEEEADNEWAQLRKMERFLEQQRVKLLQQGIPDSDDEDEDEPQWPYKAEDGLDEVEDDSLDNEDLTFNTLVLDSFSNPKSEATKLKRSGYEIPTPEGVTAQANAVPMTPREFNKKN